MSQVAWALAWTVLLVGIAGCSDDNGGKVDDFVVPDSIENVEVTDTTGALRGIVIDEKITPLAGVTIGIAGVAESKTTAGDGGFAFGGLEPGDYFITASKAGYKPIQSSGTVVAGDANPPLVKIIMAIDNATSPFVEVQNWKAFLQCGAGIPGAGSVNPCLFTGSDNVHDFFFGSGVVPDFAQVEAVWSGTQPLGNRLSLGYYDPDSLASNWKGADGESPLVVPATKEEMVDAVGEDAEKLIVRIFPGRDSPTVVVNQAYDIYISYFYNMVPREGYIFAIDGPCNPPESCK